jgi:multidrug efflux pump subunit AcrA (membrane-fusion protein)
MAEFLARRVFSRRVAMIAAVAVAGGAVAGGVAVAASASRGSAASSGGGSPVATATVVRTDLIATVQVGGSIGYGGSYTVAAPSGATASQVAQQQQAVAQDQQALSADEQAESDALSAGNQAIGAAQVNVSTDQSTLTADQAARTKDCAGAGASSAACRQDTQKVSADQAQLTQARQQLAAAQSAAKTDNDQDQAKVGSDQVRLQGDQATLASLQATATNPGTTYTWLPQPGEAIRQDQPVYAVSDEPVPLLYGSIPAYRAFYVGMSDGADVGQLTRDLIALGYGAGLAQGNHYSPATAAAVQRWQAALGLPATGEILLGGVVFEPGPIRVTSVTPSVGASAGGGGGGGGSSSSTGGGGGGGVVLTATGATPIVTVDLPVTQEYLVKSGDAVSVVLPDGTSTVGGQVETVGSVATCPGGGGTGTGGSTGGGSADQSPCSSGGSSSTPTVTVTITLDSTTPGATLDQAPVNVNVTSQRADHVLAVPVNALLALAGGGYGVDVVTGSTSRLVGVTTGLYSSTLVQVSGPGIRAGLRVEVPSS